MKDYIKKLPKEQQNSIEDFIIAFGATIVALGCAMLANGKNEDE